MPELVQSWVTDDPESVKVNLTGAIRASVLADLMEATIVAPRLDEDSLELLKRLETFTGMSPAQTVGKLFPCASNFMKTWSIMATIQRQFCVELDKGSRLGMVDFRLLFHIPFVGK